MEVFYGDYTHFHGVMFPTLITEKRGGELSLILVVMEVKQVTAFRWQSL